MSCTVHEDRIVLLIPPPADAQGRWVLALTNFLDLNIPIRRTTARTDFYYYPARTSVLSCNVILY